MLIVLMGCSTFVPVLLRPTDIQALPGKRPTIYIKYLPTMYSMQTYPLPTPYNKIAHMQMGRALEGAFNSGFSRFFSVIPREKYSNYFALVNMDKLVMETSFVQLDSASVRVTFVFKYTVPIFDRYGDTTEIIKINKERIAVIESDNFIDFVNQSTDIVSDILYDVEHDINYHMLTNDKPGKYRIERY
jgi:hypothetical protein